MFYLFRTYVAANALCCKYFMSRRGKGHRQRWSDTAVPACVREAKRARQQARGTKLLWDIVPRYPVRKEEDLVRLGLLCCNRLGILPLDYIERQHRCTTHHHINNLTQKASRHTGLRYYAYCGLINCHLFAFTAEFSVRQSPLTIVPGNPVMSCRS
jgi:hypothetical protein